MVAATFQHLFGPPTPAAVRRMRNKKFYEGETPNIRKSNKPLPGEITNHCLTFIYHSDCKDIRRELFVKILAQCVTVWCLTV